MPQQATKIPGYSRVSRSPVDCNYTQSRGRAVGFAGFTLVEAALVLAIVGAVIGLMIPTYLSIRIAEKTLENQKRMELVMRAAAAFTVANGCLPCPTPAGTAQDGAGFGIVRGDAAINPVSCSSACSVQVGLVPFRSLGITKDAAHDAYGHWFTFAVDKTLAANSAGVVPPYKPNPTATAACAKDVRCIGLCAPNLSSNLRIGINENPVAAILVLSHGANGYAAYREIPEPGVLRTVVCEPDNPRTYECENTDDDLAFTQATRTEAGDNPFDDQLLYMGRNAFVASFGTGACESAW